MLQTTFRLTAQTVATRKGTPVSFVCLGVRLSACAHGEGGVFSLQVVLLLLLPLCWVIVLHADWLFGQRVTAVPKVQKGDLPVRALPSVVAEIL